MTYCCFIERGCQSYYWPRFQRPNTHTKHPRGMTVLMWRVCLTVISSDGHGPNSWQASASMWGWVISNVGELLPFQEDTLIAGLWLHTMIVIGLLPMISFPKHWASLGWAFRWMGNSLYKQQPKSNQIIFHSKKKWTNLAWLMLTKIQNAKYAYQDPLAWCRCCLQGWRPSSSTLAYAWAEALCPLDE